MLNTTNKTESFKLRNIHGLCEIWEIDQPLLRAIIMPPLLGVVIDLGGFNVKENSCRI